MSVPDTPGTHKLAADFLRMIITWNSVEDQARSIILTTSKGGIGTYVAVTALGNVALANALIATAEYLGPDAREHIEHFVELLNRERAYRNHYVHSIWGVGVSGDGMKAAAILGTVDAKPRLRHHQSYVTDDTLREFAARLADLRLYGVRINNRLRFQFKSLAEMASKEPPTWPEKPPLPDTLKKPRTHLPWLPPPTAESPE